MPKTIAKYSIRVIALFYAYGAFVHVLNIAGVNGFDWLQAPLKWQLLDVIYLILDVVVAVGVFRAWRLATVCFYCAALSQIVLYTVFRSWIVDVPEPFTLSTEEVAYLDTLVIFHAVTLIVMTFCLLCLKGPTKPCDS